MKLVPINKIISFSVVDGPGNRTAIFLQGCNLKCAYCHNPETQNICCNCGICVDGCPAGALSLVEGKVIWDEERCILCDRCMMVCPHRSSPRTKRMTADEVFLEVEKNIPFIRGITVSGGECTLYPEFLQELFTLAKTKKLSCLIDSNGVVDLSKFPDLMDVCDGVMLDVKAWDRNTFKELTGGVNDLVMKNLKFLADINKLEEIRIVCVPMEMDAEDVICGVKLIIGDKVDKTRLKLIKFRNNGVKGRLANIGSPSDKYMNNLKQKSFELGFKYVEIA